MSSPLVDRRIRPEVEADLGAHKMVFVAGPRQSGKTTLARQVLSSTGGAYFNADVAAHRRALRSGDLPAGEPLWRLPRIGSTEVRLVPAARFLAALP